MCVLALDVGRRRTGAAFADGADGVPLALQSIEHASVRQLVAAVASIVRERAADRIVLGLPLLPSGAEGEQAAYVRSVAHALSPLGLPIAFLDERYTTDKGASDGDAKAACEILLTFLDRERNGR